MSQALLHSILTQLPSLNQEELVQVKSAVEQRLGDAMEPSAPDQSALRELYRRGLIDQLKLPHDARTSFEPVKIAGKPLSETIIEERR